MTEQFYTLTEVLAELFAFYSKTPNETQVSRWVRKLKIYRVADVHHRAEEVMDTQKWMPTIQEFINPLARDWYDMHESSHSEPELSEIDIKYSKLMSPMFIKWTRKEITVEELIAAGKRFRAQLGLPEIDWSKCTRKVSQPDFNFKKDGE